MVERTKTRTDGREETYYENMKFNYHLDRDKLIAASDFNVGDRLEMLTNPRGDDRPVRDNGNEICGQRIIVVDVIATPPDGESGHVEFDVVSGRPDDPRINDGDRLTMYEGIADHAAYMETLNSPEHGAVGSFDGYYVVPENQYNVTVDDEADKPSPIERHTNGDAYNGNVPAHAQAYAEHLDSRDTLVAEAAPNGDVFVLFKDADLSANVSSAHRSGWIVEEINFAAQTIVLQCHDRQPYMDGVY